MTEEFRYTSARVVRFRADVGCRLKHNQFILPPVSDCTVDERPNEACTNRRCFAREGQPQGSNLKGVQPPRIAAVCGCGAGWESMTGGSRAGAQGGSARAHAPRTTDDKPGDAKNFELLSTLRHDHEWRMKEPWTQSLRVAGACSADSGRYQCRRSSPAAWRSVSAAILTCGVAPTAWILCVMGSTLNEKSVSQFHRTWPISYS